MIRNNNNSNRNETRRSQLLRRGHGGGGVLSESTNTKNVSAGKDLTVAAKASNNINNGPRPSTTAANRVVNVNRISTDSASLATNNNSNKDSPTSSSSTSASFSSRQMLIGGKGKFHSQRVKMRMKNLQEKQKQQQEQRVLQQVHVQSQLDQLEREHSLGGGRQDKAAPSPSTIPVQQQKSTKKTAPAMSIAIPSSTNENKSGNDPSPLSMDDPLSKKKPSRPTNIVIPSTAAEEIITGSDDKRNDPSPLSLEDPLSAISSSSSPRKMASLGGRDTLASVKEADASSSAAGSEHTSRDDLSTTSVSSLNMTNVSSWAMMQHYNIPSNNNTKGKSEDNNANKRMSHSPFAFYDSEQQDDGSEQEPEDDIDQGRGGGIKDSSIATSSTIEYHNEVVQLHRQRRPLMSSTSPPTRSNLGDERATSADDGMNHQDKYRHYRGDDAEDSEDLSEEQDEEDQLQHDEHHAYWHNTTRASSSSQGDIEIIGSHDYGSPEIRRRYNLQQDHQAIDGDGSYGYMTEGSEDDLAAADAGEVGGLVDSNRANTAAEISPATIEWGAEDLEDSFQNKSNNRDAEGLPTPAQIRFEWGNTNKTDDLNEDSRLGRYQETGDDDDHSSPPTSLFQESTILSSQPNASGSRDDNQDEYDDQASYGSSASPSQNTETQLSTVSLQDSISGHGFYEPPTSESLVTTPTAVEGGSGATLDAGCIVDNNEDQPAAQPIPSPTKEQLTYLARIEELEQTLKEHRHMKQQEQTKLLERVADLENRLRSATPRSGSASTTSGASKAFFGSSKANHHSDMNPINTLLERNKTLVKEVRFADQTCVELSTQNSALETQVSLLQEQLSQIQQDKDRLMHNHSLSVNRKVGRASTPQSNSSNSIAGSVISSQSSLGPIPEDDQFTVDAVDVQGGEGNMDTSQNHQADNNVSIISMGASTAWMDDELLASILDGMKSDVVSAVREWQQGQGTSSDGEFAVPHNDDGLNADGDESVASQYLAKALQLHVHRLQKEEVVDEQDASSTSSNEAEIALDGTMIHMATHQRLLDDAQEEIRVLKEKLDGKEQPTSPPAVGIPITVRELRKQLATALDEKRQAEDSLKQAEERFELDRKQKIKELQEMAEQVERLTKHIYLYGDGPTSPRLQKADKRVFHLEKELAHAKADVSSLQAAATEEQNRGSKANNDTIKTLQDGLARIVAQYERLEDTVEDVMEGYTRRLTDLTETVAHLKSSFKFELETDSISTHLQQKQQDRDETLNGMMNATIQTQQYGTNISRDVPDPTDDDLLQLMEEARSPIMSPIGNRRIASQSNTPVSRQLDGTLTAASEDHHSSRSATMSFDDLTLDSLLKQSSVSVGSPVVAMNQWGDPTLHPFLEEFHRVRDQLTKMQQILKSQQTNMNRLETENGRLSLEASRRVEEKGLVEQALLQAKERLEELEMELDVSKSELKEAVVLSEERGDIIKKLTSEKSNLTEELEQVSKRVIDLESQILEVNAVRDELEKEYNEAKGFLVESKEQILHLESQLTTKEEECAAVAKVEHDRLEQALASCKSQLLLVQADLQQIVQDRNGYQSKVNELEAAVEAAASDAEDKVLSAQCRLENVRTERAELRAKIAHVQSELSSAKESLATCEERLSSKTRERDSIVEAIYAERSQAAHHAGEFAILRQELHDLLDTLDSASENSENGGTRANSPPRHSNSRQSSSFLDRSPRGLSSADVSMNNVDDQGHRNNSLNQEVRHWKDLMPSLVSSLHALRPAYTRLKQMEAESTTMVDRLQGQQATIEEYSKHSEEVRMQNETLLNMLRQAENEVDKTSNQYQELTSTVETLKRQHDEDRQQLNFLIETKSELEAALENEAKELSAANYKVSQMELSRSSNEAKIAELSESLLSTQQQLSKCNDQLQVNDTDREKLQTKILTLENKCSKLRDYIRKLTTKCEEWERSYEKQSQRLEKNTQQYRETRRKASEIARRYTKLASDVEQRKKVHLDDQEKWKYERSNMENVHTQLEMELEEIAKELSNIDVLWNSPIPK